MGFERPSFKKILLVFELCSVGYFVAAHPDVCVDLVTHVPGAARAVAANPKILLRLLPGHNGGQSLLPSVADVLSGKVRLPPVGEALPSAQASEPVEHTAAIGGAMPVSDAPSPPQAAAPAPSPAPQAPAETSVAKLPAATPAVAPVSNVIQPKIVTQATKAAAATVNTAKTEYDKHLDAAFAMSDGDQGGDVASASARRPAPTPVPLKTTVLQVERTQVSTRFLHLVIGEATLRFHVANGMTEKDIVNVSENLKNACLKQTEKDVCDRKHSSLQIDPQLFSEIQSTKVADWSPGAMPGTGLIWRLTCSNGTDECLSSRSRARAYRLTMARAKENEMTLARGFETRVIHASFSISGARKPASVVNARAVQRAYVTHASASTTKFKEAGSL